MGKNDRNSCTGNLRYIHIRYFFVKDRCDKGEIDIGYCPTKNILAYLFNKLITGALFIKFRDVLMSYKNINSLLSISKERVKNSLNSINSNL